MTRRVGLIVPSSNTVAEVDFYRTLPLQTTLHTARMRLVQTTAKAEAQMLDEHLPTAIADLASARPDLVVFGCTSAGALRGNAYEARLIERLADEAHAEAISVAASVRAALALREARRVGVITPYVDELNDKIRGSLEADGFEVVWMRGMGIVDNFAIAAVAPAEIAAFAAASATSDEIDVLFASCTNFRALAARSQIEQQLGVPVVTSNQAALEAVLDRLGMLTRI